MNSKRIGVVIVSYGHERDVANLVDSLAPQLREGDRVVVVDNRKPWVLQEAVGDRLRVHGVEIINHDNGGFAAGCNVGAARIVDEVDLLFFLNPDTVIEDPSLFDTLRRVDERWAAFMPYLLLEDGSINSAGNALHISGLSWVTGLDGEAERGGGQDQEVTEISIASGACLVVRSQWWRKLGGMEEMYFMYHEDTDFSARLLLAGARIGLVHSAFVTHNYDYAKGDYKWIYIERNRHVLLLSVLPLPLLVALGPQILGANLGLWAIAAREGRLGLKLKSTRLLLRDLPGILALRRRTQALRRVGAAEYLSHMEWRLDNPHLGNIGKNRVVAAIYGTYYRMCLSVLRLLSA
ncbi:glycosyltransferase family 2 protein [Corynebacterium pacaense]|uniref:glycosyltransferase family 2 protein n=1 Tax=Corynebacterium pacaense TaxID=1816684 RepID=UPI0009B97B4A|nr:glycosyltransferase family 2 protein [Corynebacterium pacaense]